METILNALGPVRRERLGDREYLVAPVTMIVPGVLPGSKGPLFYPNEEVGNTTVLDSWNGIPAVIRHPVDPVTGLPVSARQPHVLAEYGVGQVFSNNYDGQHKAEAWLEVAALNRVKDGKVILQKLSAGEPIEVSTGLFTTNEPAPAGATHNGRPYTHVARNYRPDHLALLPDEKGACSVKDGCGINNRSTVTNSESVVNKGELVSWLTTNCDCWKGKEPALNAMDEPTLTALKTQVTANKELAEKVTLVTNDAAMYKKKAEDMDAEMKKSKGPACPPATTNAQTPAPQPATPSQEPKPMTTNEWMAAAPAEVRNFFQNAKQQLVDRLTANLGDAAQKKAANDFLINKEMGELNMLVSMLPAPAPVSNTQQPPVQPASPFTLFLPAGGPALNGTPAEKDPGVTNKQPLAIPTINWEEEAKKTDKERATSV